jgi:hypothetical protein
MDSRDVNETAKPAVNQGYRQGLVTAITVFLGFSLSFMRFWSFENPATGVGRIYSRAVSSPLESGCSSSRYSGLSISEMIKKYGIKHHGSILLLGHHDSRARRYCCDCRSSLTSLIGLLRREGRYGHLSPMDLVHH